ncbi:MAG: exodeoxyribonuclease VII small subunit [Oscillospiraceae bacterium]|nr:exodeoxyribonuclease VII small subunit [Oscillospiraceae bacterium]
MKKAGFEEQMARLEEIVKMLEKGDASLDDSLALFTEGTKLIKTCGKLLDEAEQKVMRLQKGEDGEPVEIPFVGENE